MSPRAHGSGSLEERPKGSGKWLLRVRVGTDPATGKPMRRNWTIEAKNKTEAAKQARAIIADLDEGPETGSQATFAALLEEWMTHSQLRGRAPATLDSNRRMIDRVIGPALGAVPLNKLTARKIDDFYSAQLKRGMSASTVRRYHAIISAALNQAVKWDYLPASPMAKVSPPKVTSQPLQLPTVQQISDIITTLQGMNEAYGMAAFLAVTTGARRGEVLALRWSDLGNNRLHVKASVYNAGREVGLKSTKTGTDRYVYLGANASAVLATWQARCEALAREVGAELADDAFIISSWPDGSRLVNPRSLTARFSEAARSLGLPHVHFHSLRHFAATELLAAGVSPQDAATALGHANPTMTLNVYAHATADRLAAAGAVLDRALERP